MKKLPLLLVAVLVAVVQFGTPVSGQQGQVRRSVRAIPDQYIVVLSGTDDPLAVGLETQQLFNGRLRHIYQSALKGFSIRMTAAAAQALARDPRVAYVEEDGLAQLNDVQTFPPSWGLDRIDQRNRPLDSSYSYPPPATQVHVHVLDTGVLPTHVEFGGRANVAGDFINDGMAGIDCHGHGTHVSGTIGGATYGVAKDVLIHGYRVLDCSGSGAISGIVAGIDAVVADGRRPAVANMSLGGGPSLSLDTAVRNAITAGITFVVAAGNDSVDASLESPSRVAEAITVGATDINDSKPGFSNFGSVLDLFAPGVNILSAFIGSNTATATLSGTSMASPHVAGVAALYLEQNGNKTPQQVRDAIVAAATTNVLANIGTNSPNRLLYSAFTIPPPPARVNVAAAINGGVATASSAWAGYPATAVNNGDRRGSPYGGGGTWSDGTGNVFPDWVQIDFSGAKTIDEVDVFGLQDNHGAPVDPTPAQTCSGCPADFTVQYWTGATWQAVPNGVVRNNSLVWRTVQFGALTTSRIRVLVERSATGWSELAEVEAYTSTGGAPVNTPPTVSLSSPLEGDSKVAPASFTLTALAGDAEAPVAKVQFFNGNTMLNEDTVSPFTFDWTNVAAGTYTLTAVAFDSGGLSTTSAAVHVTVTSPGGGGARVNVAAAINGGVATASSAWAGYPATAVNNGDRRGSPYGGGGTWSDGTGNVFPDWVQIDFSGAQTIDEVDVFGVQDNHGSPVDPTPLLTCSGCPVDFTVQYWTGAAWQAVPNGIVRNNTLVWRTVQFGALTTSRIRLLVERTTTGWSEVAEVEAYTSTGGVPANTPPTVTLSSPAEGDSKVAPAAFTLTAQASDAEAPVTKVQFFNGNTLLNEDTASPFTFDWTNVAVGTYTLTAVAFDAGGLSTTSAAVHVTVTSPDGGGARVNVAAAVNGGAVSASSAWAGYPPGAVNNGDRRGAPYGNGGTWSDGTGNVYPDWLQIDFAGAKTIDEVDVFGLQNNHTAPVDPTPVLTCSGCPVDFTVQYWTGVAWQAVPNGVVRSNTLVWRTVSFAPITTSRIRLLVERSTSGWSEVAEVEAYGTDPVP